jgi:hypothetical protein
LFAPPFFLFVGQLESLGRAVFHAGRFPLAQVALVGFAVLYINVDGTVGASINAQPAAYAFFDIHHPGASGAVAGNGLLGAGFGAGSILALMAHYNIAVRGVNVNEFNPSVASIDRPHITLPAERANAHAHGAAGALSLVINQLHRRFSFPGIFYFRLLLNVLGQ